MPKPRKLNLYTVYDIRDGLPVAVSLTARQCAEAMGVTLSSFRTIYTKLKNGCKHVGHRWEIYRDEPGEEE